MKLLKPFEIDFAGINMVEASAGTGKTYNITSLYIRAIIEHDISVKKILVVTYTEAATKELKDRLLRRISESLTVMKTQKVKDKSDQFLKDLLEYVDDYEKAVSRLEKAVREFDESAVYTIHGFCYHALQEQAFESRMLYDAEMIGDDSEVVLEVVDDYWRNWVAEISEKPHKYPLLEMMLENGYNPEKLVEELGRHIGKEYLKILPADENPRPIEDRLSEFWELYGRLKEIWLNEKDELFSLLDTGNLSYYTTNKLGKWFDLMNDFLEPESPQVNTFTQFYRFQQTGIDDSLNKGAREKGLEPPSNKFFQVADQYSELLESIRRYEIEFKKDLLLYLRKELKQRKEKLQVLSYDDLLLRLQEALSDGKRGELLSKQIREKYPLAFVDEFQDTDPVQYNIFRRIYNTGSNDFALFLIGDPKQSIYSFRGADVFSYLDATIDAPENKIFKLERNFRSSPGLIKGLNKLWDRHENPFILDEISYNSISPGKNIQEYDSFTEYGQQNPPIRFRLLSGEQDNKSSAAEMAAMDTADEIYSLIQGGKKGEITIGSDFVEAKDIAVLVRTHKQANLIKEALQKKGIKSVQYSQESVFESDEARYLQVFLKAVAEPSNERQVKTALSLPLTAFTANDLLEIEEDEQRWIHILDKFSRWHKMWQDQGFAPMFRSMLQEADISTHLIKLSEGERRLTNILHLGELLQAESLRQKEGARGLLKWLSQKREGKGLRQDEEQLRLESDRELVKVVTMHRSKGLEYPIVFCPFLWYGPWYSDSGQPLIYHEHDNERRAFLDLTGKANPDRSDHRFKAEIENLSESLRLAYVAMTRAKHCLYVSCHFADSTEFSALGYLFQDQKRTEELLQIKLGDQKYHKPQGDDIFESIEQLCTKYPHLFSIGEDIRVEGSQLDLIGSEENVDFGAVKFRRKVPLKTGYSISSFSSLTSWMDEDPDTPDYDQFIYVPDGDSDTAVEESEMSMFSFPKGPQPGTCIHNIFELIDFTNLEGSENVIKEQLSAYGIDLKWTETVLDMLDLVLKKQLLPGDLELSLSALGSTDRIAEMEFYYRNEHISAEDLISIIRDGNHSRKGSERKADHGFFKGFIDLTFSYKGRFYLLDYKTNYLGDSINDYKSHHLKEEIYEASYDLQYHIYTIALHRFLKRMVSGYSYEKNFGGAFYLFLRGMNTEGDEGVFFDRPSGTTIQQLDRYILEGGHND